MEVQKYLDHLKSYTRGANNDRTNLNTYVEMCPSIVTISIYLFDEEKLVFTLSNLQTYS